MLSDDERKRIVLVRAKWDVVNSEHWHKLAKTLESDPVAKVIQARLEQERQVPAIRSESNEANWWDGMLAQALQGIAALRQQQPATLPGNQ